MMETGLDILAVFFLVWAGLKIIDVIIETFSFLGGDGIQPYDVMWWISRPFSFRQFAPFRLPMLIGLLVWIGLLWGTFWGFNHFLMS